MRRLLALSLCLVALALVACTSASSSNDASQFDAKGPIDSHLLFDLKPFADMAPHIDTLPPDGGPRPPDAGLADAGPVDLYWPFPDGPPHDAYACVARTGSGTSCSDRDFPCGHKTYDTCLGGDNYSPTAYGGLGSNGTKEILIEIDTCPGGQVSVDSGFVYTFIPTSSDACTNTSNYMSGGLRGTNMFANGCGLTYHSTMVVEKDSAGDCGQFGFDITYFNF